MIEFLTAKEGDRIFKWSGRLLCTSIAPRLEALKWVQTNQARLQKYNEVVILGLGNGFHILEILRLFKDKKIVVINFCPEILVPALSIIGNRAGQIRVISSQKTEDLMSDEKFKAILSRPFGLLDFPPAMGLDTHLYKRAKEILLGRTQESIAFYAKARSHFAKQFNVHELQESRSSSGVRLIDIKQISQNTKWNEMSCLESCALHALGELAK